MHLSRGVTPHRREVIAAQHDGGRAVKTHDEMTDEEVLRTASQSLSALPVASPPDLQTILAMARRRRQTRAVRNAARRRRGHDPDGGVRADP
jgi:hypothetical protein